MYQYGVLGFLPMIGVIETEADLPLNIQFLVVEGETYFKD